MACSSHPVGLQRSRILGCGVSGNAASSLAVSRWHRPTAAWVFARLGDSQLRQGRGPLLTVNAGGPSGGLNKAKRPGGKEVRVLVPLDAGFAGSPQVAVAAAQERADR